MFQYAKKYITDNSQYSPVMLKDTPKSQEFPLIIMKKVRNDLYDENLDKTDQRFWFGYELKIYSMDNPNIVRQEITEELVKLIYEVFFEHYGMDIKADYEIPNVDLDVTAWYMRFEAKIDENKRIYRR